MYQPTAIQVILTTVAALLLHRISQSLIYRYKTTRLRGPTRSKVFGIAQSVAGSSDPGAVYESWVKEYGPVFRVHGPFHTERIVLCDPRAVTHVCARDVEKYSQTPTNAKLLSNICGETNVICLQGEAHKRTRKVLNSVWGPTAMKNYVPILFDAAFKVKTAWDGMFQTTDSEGVTINVGEWMEKMALDVIGLSAFSHDFGSLAGQTSSVMEVLHDLSRAPPSRFAMIIMLLSQAFPSLIALPLPRSRLIAKLSETMRTLARDLLKKAREHGGEEKSTLGVLVASEESLSETDIIVQMKTILIAGNETTAVSLKWALVELSKHQDKQDALREELTASPSEPSPEELLNRYPYLDAVVREVTRLHPFGEVLRTAVEDDIVPLSQPIIAANGRRVTSISVAKHSTMVVPVHCINRSVAIWGPNAKDFMPERWLSDDGIPEGAKQFSGYHHSLTFFDGPRTCLGKFLAISEMKAVLSVLIRNYKFLPRDGPDTKYVMERRLIPHPVVAGEGNKLPMRVIRVEDR